MEMGVDEARHRDTAASLDDAPARVASVGADDRVAADGDIGGDQGSRDEVEEPDVLDHEVGGFGAPPLGDPPGECLGRCRHAGSPLLRRSMGQSAETGKPPRSLAATDDAPRAPPQWAGTFSTVVASTTPGPPASRGASDAVDRTRRCSTASPRLR